ncbi:MAG: hypothetical protein A2W85_03685 [Bacteroidetes bacterium GWF2_41_31]|nr:MAG: hypothetical protein A2W85_03685 [Bacteroidetes bacterium GWF2_41_31]
MAVFVFFCQNLYSQCKLERKTDDFSTKKTVYSPDVTLVSIEPFGSGKFFWNLDMSFYKEDSTLVLYITHASQSYSSRVFSIFFKFKDGTIIKKSESVNSSDYAPGNPYRYTFTVFSLTKDELKIFAMTELEKFHAEFTQFDAYPVIEKEIKKKSIEKIKKDASCMLLEFK